MFLKWITKQVLDLKRSTEPSELAPTYYPVFWERFDKQKWDSTVEPAGMSQVSLLQWQA